LEKRLVFGFKDATALKALDPVAPLSRVADSHDERQVIGGEEEQSATHRPRFDERALLPQRCLHVGGTQPIDTRPQRQFGGRHDLRLHADQAVHGVHESHTRREAMLREPPSAHLIPRQYFHGSRLLSRLHG